MAANWRGDSTIYKKYITELVVLYNQRDDIKIFTELLLSLAAIFVFGIFAIRPTLVTIGGLNSEIAVKRETLSTMDQKITNIDIAQNLIDTQRARIALLNQAVPAIPDEFNFIRQIEGIAGRHQVTFVSFAIERIELFNKETITPTEGPIVIPATEQLSFSVTVEGSYTNLSLFVADMDFTRRPISQISSVISSSDDPGNTNLTLTIVGVAPFLRKSNE